MELDQSKNPEPQEKEWFLSIEVDMLVFGTDAHVDHAVGEVERWLRAELKDLLVDVQLMYKSEQPREA